MRSRRIGSVALAIAGAAVLVAGLLAFYARTQVLDEARFADRAGATLEDDAVRDFVGDQIVTAVIERGQTDLLAARPLLETVVRTAIDTEPFERIFRRAALEANRVLFARDRPSVAFELSDASQVVRFALQQFAPELADQVPKELDLALVELKEREFARETLDIADQVRTLGLVLPIGALVLFALAILAAPDRRLGVLRCAAAAAAATGALAVVMLIVRDRALAGTYGSDETSDAEIRDALSGALDAFLGDLLVWALAIALGGVVVAAAAAVLDPEDVEAPLARLRRRAAPPEGRAARGIWGAAVIALGVLVALEPDASLRLLAFGVAALLLFIGASQLLATLGRPDTDPAEAERARRRSLVGASAAGLAFVAVIAVVTLVLAESASDPDARASTAAGTCNGSKGLCDLRLDQAVFGGTHNSFSAADSPGWFIANQRRTISRQLADGVRLLLLDPHYGVGSTGKVSTDFDAEGRDENRVARQLPPETLDAAQRLTGSLGLGGGGATGEQDVWLCHTVCELGATRMTDALGAVSAFLERNPGEVVILYVEPFVAPDDLEAVFRRSGLLDDLARLDPGLPMPTLGELVGAGRRVLVITERGAGPEYPWYHDDDEFVQDTPLGITQVGQLSCEPNRGTAANPLLMLNMWADVFPPRVEPNIPFNDKQLILDQVDECERVRDHQVNLIGVDFYDRGGLIDAVDELNAERVAALEGAREAAGLG
ncbi:MAG TPA: hypothetical protein VFY99_01660 [Solirubrobacterales bacterium]